MTVKETLVAELRRMGHYTKGDQVPPCAILWPDPESQWAEAIAAVRDAVPELFILGPFQPDQRTGPAVWLRCVEARTVEIRAPDGTIPIFYLPRVSRQDLRAAEDCPAEWLPLVELQFRGAVWAHVNGRDWTPYAFLVSQEGGLGLDVARDEATEEALRRALPVLLEERVAGLHGQKLASPQFNELLAPDLPRKLLGWMNDPKQERQRVSASEWKAFCEQCQGEYQFRPDKDGELKAAELLGHREASWPQVWQRFAEAPQRYPGVVKLLERITPTTTGQLTFNEEPWPYYTDAAERELDAAFRALAGQPRAAAVQAVQQLEQKHGRRRGWVWNELGRSPLAAALKPLVELAQRTSSPLAGESADALAQRYSEDGWRTDAAAIAAMAFAREPGKEPAISTVVRALYFPWLEESARNLQQLSTSSPLTPRGACVSGPAGRVVLFADGLRMDLARQLQAELNRAGCVADLQWDWTVYPSVTPTAKPFVSPVRELLTGAAPDAEFSTAFSGDGKSKLWTQERFEEALGGMEIQVLSVGSLGDPTRKGWLETGTIDKHGHNEGWKLAALVSQEIAALRALIQSLLAHGWREIEVVTDHGWLTLPGDFPKAEMPKFLTEHRWGRCAMMTEQAHTELPVRPWHWNPLVRVASPFGVAAFKAGLSYAHGGISAQEMVVPRLMVRSTGAAPDDARIAKVQWSGLRCRITVEGNAKGLTADLRSRPAAAESSLQDSEAPGPKALGSNGTVSIVAQDSAEGSAAVVVLLRPDGTVLHTQLTTIGGTA